MSTGRQPDYKLRVLNKLSEQKGEIGAAWINSDGRISIVLNPCVVMTGEPNFVYCLFKHVPYEKRPPQTKEPPPAGSYASQEDITF